MSSNRKALRVGILRLRCQEPRRYYLTLQCHPISSKASDSTAARTETSEPSRNPDFSSSSCLLRLPLPLADLPPDQPLLRVELFSVSAQTSPGVDADPGVQHKGGVLVGSGLVGSGGGSGGGSANLTTESIARLLQGQRVTITVALRTMEAMDTAAAATTMSAGRTGEERAVVGSRSFIAGLAPYEVLLELELLDANSNNNDNNNNNRADGVDLGVGGVLSNEPLEALIQECQAKQAALAKLSQQLDARTAQVEVLTCRLGEAESNSRSLVEDNTRLQELLHAEQQAWRIPQLRLLIDSAMLSREELIERCESAMAAYGRERARNGELVERLKLLHAEQVDALELKKRYQRLQEAHEDQARAYTDVEEHGGKVAHLQATIKTQEEIIRNLEALLAQAVQKVKPKSAQDATSRTSISATDGADAPGAEKDVVSEAEAKADLQSQLATAEQIVQQLQEELAAQQAATQERTEQMQRMEAELEALQQHTVTEFPPDASGAVPDKNKPGTANTGKHQPEDNAPDAEGVAEEVGKLQAEVAQLTEDKTAALLRAEYAEGAAEAAQNELVDVTRKCAREIAALKTRLAEKDAAMMGGFGGLDALPSRSQPPFPAFPSPPAFSGVAGQTAASTARNGSGGSSSGSSRRVPDALRSPAAAANSSTTASGAMGRTGQGGQGEQAAGAGLSGLETSAEGARSLAWMKSRRGGGGSQSLAQRGDEAGPLPGASPVPVAEG